jgi:hypothetical protein
LVMDGRSRTGLVIDFINLYIERKSYIVANQLKMLIPQEMLDVVLGSGKKLSRQMTSFSSWSSRSHKWEPKKPAPPVTSTRFRS